MDRKHGLKSCDKKKKKNWAVFSCFQKDAVLIPRRKSNYT